MWASIRPDNGFLLSHYIGLHYVDPSYFYPVCRATVPAI